jgi:putative flavoprotein involved in K+ transport
VRNDYVEELRCSISSLKDLMSIERVQTLVVGGGQAGLAMSHMLSKRGCPHLLLERSRIAERWRTERWDGLRFQFPNWSVQLPDFPGISEDAARLADHIAAARTR